MSYLCSEIYINIYSYFEVLNIIVYWYHYDEKIAQMKGITWSNNTTTITRILLLDSL